MIELAALTEMDRRLRAMADAENPSDVFRILLQCCCLAVPRAAVFLVRHGQIRGWNAFGYEPAVTEAQRAYDGASNPSWLDRMAADPASVLEARQGAAPDPDFGQRAAAEAVASVIRVKGKPIAFVVGERSTDESPWLPGALGILATVAQLRLELDLTLRRLRDAPVESSTAASCEPPATTDGRSSDARVESHSPRSSAPSPAGSRETPTLVGQADPDGPAPAADASELDPVDETPDPPEVTAARRYARLVATDIRLYNEEAVAQGRRNGDLSDRLGEDLGRGKETFLRRHGDLGPRGLELLHEAYVQVLAGGDTHLIPNLD